jgi:hypothetical protein
MPYGGLVATEPSVVSDVILTRKAEGAAELAMAAAFASKRATAPPAGVRCR